MKVTCPRCLSKLGKVNPESGGHPARCEACGGEFILPFVDADRLLEWVQTAPWDDLDEAIRTNIGRGHSRTTVTRLVQLFEKRREREIWRLEREEHGEVLTGRDRLWRALERQDEQRQWQQQTLEEILCLDPSSFERMIADLFSTQGYQARAVGGTDDQGIDVKIWDSSGSLWGVAQCKRYGPEGRIASRDIRDFAGSYLISGAEMGFYFTTGNLTRDAKQTAKQFPWLTVYEGVKLLNYVLKIRKTRVPDGAASRENEVRHSISPGSEVGDEAPGV